MGWMKHAKKARGRKCFVKLTLLAQPPLEFIVENLTKNCEARHYIPCTSQSKREFTCLVITRLIKEGELRTDQSLLR